MNYDLGLAWNWEYDGDLASLLEAACQARNQTLLQITPDTLETIVQGLASGQIALRSFFDRASDADERFLAVAQWARQHARLIINPYEQAVHAWDKVAMHLALSPTLHTPYTVILPSCQERPDLPAIDLGLLGNCFSIKPAHGGGGEGVVVEATSLDQVQVSRQEYPSDRYLLQAHVAPAQMGTRLAWYRLIYCAGRVYPCWWDTQTHVYTPATPAEETRHGLGPLAAMAGSIARICGLDLFSTEIARTVEGQFIVVDYVNDPIDLRLQSKSAEGVPDAIVQDVARRLAALVAGALSRV